MQALRNMMIVVLITLGSLVPTNALANRACVEEHLSNTAFRLDVKLGAPAETDEQRIAAFLQRVGSDLSPSDYAGLCRFLDTDSGAAALADAKWRVFEEVKGDGPFTLKTDFGSFIYEPNNRIEIGIDSSRFAFEFKSIKTGEYLGTMNIYASTASEKSAIYFLISETYEKISTGSKVSKEFEKILITSSGYNLLKIDVGSAPCGDVRRLPVRTERARFKTAIKDLHSMLLNDYIDMPTYDNEAVRKLIFECFLKVTY